jgi:hypothetical protein
MIGIDQPPWRLSAPFHTRNRILAARWRLPMPRYFFDIKNGHRLVDSFRNGTCGISSYEQIDPNPMDVIARPALRNLSDFDVAQRLEFSIRKPYTVACFRSVACLDPI